MRHKAACRATNTEQIKPLNRYTNILAGLIFLVAPIEFGDVSIKLAYASALIPSRLRIWQQLLYIAIHMSMSIASYYLSKPKRYITQIAHGTHSNYSREQQLGNQSINIRPSISNSSLEVKIGQIDRCQGSWWCGARPLYPFFRRKCRVGLEQKVDKL